MSTLREARLWAAQRATAAILAGCVFVHLATILYAVRGGLTAAEILGRTRGSAAWAAFYALFVVAAAIHASIGLRNVLTEWTPWRGTSMRIAVAAFATVLLAAGLRAVWAVFA